MPTYDDASSLPESDLPAYTILVPLYHEASALPGLVEHLRKMDYPPEKLRILLLIEADDEETQGALANIEIAPPFEVVMVPVSMPRTKPKACNVGLRLATGDLLVIYDAEDRPETDQLRKAAAVFAKSPAEAVCLQAKLNFYNRDRNFLTRLFTAEYSGWFDFCLPGLARLDAPIPLGGTSNHFRLDALRALKGWDPYNVTEDCDLGIRLYTSGWYTELLDSTTWEEATFRLWPWIRQRSRWVKGYLQTYLVHLRHPFAIVRKIGLERALHLHFMFGATCFCLLMNPFYWALTLWWFIASPHWIRDFFPLWLLLPAMSLLIVGNAAFVLYSMLACLNRRNYRLVPRCLAMPLYWVLTSFGAWKGTLQLITRPYYWEKTPHVARTTWDPKP